LNGLSKIEALALLFGRDPAPIKLSHSFRQYLHIEAVFVFERRVDHWFAPSSGQTIRIARIQER
jgi:hypothetical protein